MAIQLQRVLLDLDGGVVIARFGATASEQHQGVRIVGSRSEDLAAQRLGFVEIASFEGVPCVGQGLANYVVELRFVELGCLELSIAGHVLF